MSTQRAVTQRAVPPQPDAEASEAEARRRAKIVPTALPLKPVTAPGDDPPSPAVQARDLARRHLGRVLSGDSLLRLDRPSVGATWAAHRQAAARHNGAALRSLRLLYGLPHTGATALSYVLLWATATPGGLVLTAVILAALIYWF